MRVRLVPERLKVSVERRVFRVSVTEVPDGVALGERPPLADDESRFESSDQLDARRRRLLLALDRKRRLDHLLHVDRSEQEDRLPRVESDRVHER